MIQALSVEMGLGRFGLLCADNAFNMLAWGNQDSGYDAYLSFFQDVAKLDLDYSKYEPWRALTEHAGPRVMHAEFCMIADRPEVLLVDADNRPHCEDGPFCRWRDGFALYSLHGIRVSQQVVEAPETLTFAEVRDEPNTEVRRYMLDRFGGLRGSAAAGEWLRAGNLKPISETDITAKMQPSGRSIWRLSNGDAPVLCKLFKAELPDDEPLLLLWVVCTSTAKEVFLRVPPTFKDAAKARDWTFGESLAEAVET